MATQPHSRLTHTDAAGGSRMVDVSGKSPTTRSATAEATVFMSPELLDAIKNDRLSKGSVFEPARLARISAEWLVCRS